MSKPKRTRKRTPPPTSATPNPEIPEQLASKVSALGMGAERTSKVIRALLDEHTLYRQALKDALAKDGVSLYGRDGLMERAEIDTRETVILELWSCLDQRLEVTQAMARDLAQWLRGSSIEGRPS